MFSLPKILFLVSLLFVALLNPKFNPYLLFKFLIFYHSSNITIDILHLIGIRNGSRALKYACFDFHTECSTMIPFLSFIRGLDTRQTNKSVLMIVEKL